MAEIDPKRAAVARKVVLSAFNKEYPPNKPVPTDAVSRVMYAQRLNNAGNTVTFGTSWRWLSVDPDDLGNVTLFGHFYGVAYAHLVARAETAEPDLEMTEKLAAAITEAEAIDGGEA